MLSVYKLPDRFFLCASTKTEAGFHIASEPTCSVARDASDSDLGRHVYDLLQAALRLPIVPTPQRNQYRELGRKILRNSGCRSWLAIHRKAKLCTVLDDSETITIIPMRNGGTKGVDKGFSPLREKMLTFNDLDCGTIGERLREAFRLCE